MDHDGTEWEKLTLVANKFLPEPRKGTLRKKARAG
jgi:hypothetical protein